MAKTYIEGTSCKAIQGQFWEFFNISLNYEKLAQYANEKWYINMTMSKRKEVWQYGDTHYFVLNEWKPEGGDNNNAWSNNSNQTDDSQGDISVSDVPF